LSGAAIGLAKYASAADAAPPPFGHGWSNVFNDNDDPNGYAVAATGVGVAGGVVAP